MLKTLAEWSPQFRSGFAPNRVSATLLPFFIAAVMICASPGAGQTIKGAVASAQLEPISLEQWSKDLGYRKTELYPLALDVLGCPFIQVDVSGVKLSLMLDSGTARGLVITNQAPPVPHRVEGRTEQLNADGSHRGESFNIRLNGLSVLGKVFDNVAGSLCDWRMFSSVPFNGTVGLDFFLDRRLTLDYRTRRVAVTSSPLAGALNPKRYLSADLVEAPESQGHILYARARVNGREAIVYIDTGYNVSFIDPAFAEGLPRVERPGKFRVFREHVPVEMGGQTFIYGDLRETEIHRGEGLVPPVAMILGSDILSHFIVTIDLRVRKLIIAAAK